MNVSKLWLPLFNLSILILVTTIAGPLGEDEEEIGEERDQDMSSEEEYDGYEIIEGETDQLCSEKPDQHLMYESDHDGEGELISEESDSEIDLLRSLPRQLHISQTMTPIKKNHSLTEKFRHSPKLASSFNNSVLTPRKSELSMNLSCLSCGNQTDYSADMGITEKQFEVLKFYMKIVFDFKFIFSSAMSVCSQSIRTARMIVSCARGWQRKSS